MRYLILMDDLRQYAPWIAVLALVFVSVMLIWSPRMSRDWRRKMTRVAGVVCLAVATLAGVLFGFFASLDPPREHFLAISPDGSRVALLSHSEFRDGAATEVTVAPNGCCTRLLAYRYFGDGDDYAGARSLKWIDDHHLKVEYVQDSSGTQVCAPQIGDIEVICNPRLENLPALNQQPVILKP